MEKITCGHTAEKVQKIGERDSERAEELHGQRARHLSVSVINALLCTKQYHRVAKHSAGERVVPCLNSRRDNQNHLATLPF